MDDIFLRFLKSLGIILGGFLLIYFLISVSGERPVGLSLIIYQGMNTLFLWVFRLLVTCVLGFIIFEVSAYYLKSKEENKLKLLEAQRLAQQELIEEDERIQDLKKKQTKEEQRLESERLAKIEIDLRAFEKEQYLKTRSAEDANSDALKHFL